MTIEKEDVEETVDEQPEVETEDGMDDESWLEKRGGAKSVREEWKRKKEADDELKNLREEKKKWESTPKPETKPESAPQSNFSMPDGKTKRYPPAIQKYFDRSLSLGINEDYARAQCDAMYETTSEAIGYSKHLYDGLSPVQQDYKDRQLERVMKGFKDDKDTKVIVTKYEQEVEQYFKDKVDPSKWKDKDTQNQVIGAIMRLHQNELFSPSDEKGGKTRVSDGENISSGTDGSGVSDDELESVAMSGGYDLSTTQGRRDANIAAKRRSERDQAKRDAENR